MGIGTRVGGSAQHRNELNPLGMSPAELSS